MHCNRLHGFLFSTSGLGRALAFFQCYQSVVTRQLCTSMWFPKATAQLVARHSDASDVGYCPVWRHRCSGPDARTEEGWLKARRRVWPSACPAQHRPHLTGARWCRRSVSMRNGLRMTLSGRESSDRRESATSETRPDGGTGAQGSVVHRARFARDR